MVGPTEALLEGGVMVAQKVAEKEAVAVAVVGMAEAMVVGKVAVNEAALMAVATEGVTQEVEMAEVVRVAMAGGAVAPAS